MNLKLTFAAVAAMALMLPAFAAADHTILLRVTGARGLFPGSGPAASDHDINALTFSSPSTRPQAGLHNSLRPVGNFVTITKFSDYASKALHGAFTSKGELPDVLIQFFEPNSDKQPHLVMTLELRNVRITDDHTFFPPAPAGTPGAPGQASPTQMQRVRESITFTYGQIKQTYFSGHSSANVNLKEWAPQN